MINKKDIELEKYKFLYNQICKEYEFLRDELEELKKNNEDKKKTV